MDQEKLTQLPLSRIKTVMKTSPSIGPIHTEALFLMCRAAEMFVEHIAKKAHKKGSKTLEYKHLAGYVESEDALEFLVQILPQKITVNQYKKIMEGKKGKGDEDDSDSDDEDSSSESGEEEEEEGSDDSGSASSSEEDDEEEEEKEDEDADSVISIKSSSSDEKENSKNMGNKKTPVKHKTGDSP